MILVAMNTEKITTIFLSFDRKYLNPKTKTAEQLSYYS